MKKTILIFLSLLLFSALVKAQKYQDALLFGKKENGVAIGRVLMFPTGCGTPSTMIAADSAIKKAAVYFDSCNNKVWVYNPAILVWDTVHIGRVSAGGGSGISEFIAGYGLVNLNDSSAKVDSLIIATVLSRNHLRDSLLSVISAKVPTSRTLTINGVTYDLSANRTWTISGGTGGISMLGSGWGLIKVNDSTYRVDSSLVKSAWQSDKTRDSLLTIIATKQNTITPAALTKTDDTNVTLTLGGSPSTALLNAASITVGWAGTLADGRIASASTWNAKEGPFTETIEEFTGSTSSTVTVANTPKTSKARIVYFNGVRMLSSNVSISGSSFTISGITRETSDVITVKYSY